ncbi:hypothetical protein VM1G_10485 [Cytospora mali]|uniref:DUF676 domain-containing protein n=1 Tax=Cytospora mali TaxID=578113 RepID=A0A194VIQ1_CYTMA|nr:hypothetical protein VM1G_10485 [Valsa mali]
MSRTLLLCFIHGFKVGDKTNTLLQKLLKERVMEIRKARLEKPWPPTDKNVGVILVAHSMGGFVASEALFHALDERASSDDPSAPLFPMIQGILAFDTPYNGLARSMFVYGAFSNYQKVSSVFNVMTALSAAPASLGMALKRGATSLPGSSRVSNAASWKAWQLIAVRTGTVGAIAAGGVAAYIHREQIKEGLQNMRTLKKQDLVEGYQQSVDRLGQGLAYVNRGNVGKSFAWLSDHFTFVGVLLKQQELNKRLERLAKLQGIGIHDIYASMGENGYWSGGYFVPERTFCAVPAEDQPANNLYSRHVIKNTGDEIETHMSMFKPDKNEEYQLMVNKASKLVVMWFNDESEIVDNPEITKPEPADSPENAIKATDEGVKVEAQAGIPKDLETKDLEDSDEIPDESPLDIAAAASLVPLPEDAEGTEEEAVPEVKDKQSYYRYLMSIAQNTGTGIQQAGSGVKGYIPTKLPTIPKPSMPSMNIPSVSVPGAGFFSKKEKSTASEENSAATPSEKATEGTEKTESANDAQESAAAATEGQEKITAE